MKKSLIVILASSTLFALSCTKTCSCEDTNGKVTQLEVNPSEKCADRSGSEYGTCSNN